MNVIWISEAEKEDEIGDKALNLSYLYKLKIPVPQGFIITKEAFRDFIDHNNLGRRINSILNDIDLTNIRDIDLKSKEIENLFSNSEFPEDLKKEILESYENLNVNNEISKYSNLFNLIKSTNSWPYVAVRPSLIKRFDNDITFLNVKGNLNLLNSIRKAWSSLFNLSAIINYKKDNLNYNEYLFSLIIQRMINSEKSGIINIDKNINIKALFGYYGLINSVKSNKYILNNDAIKKEIPIQDHVLIRNETTSNVVKIKLDKKDNQVLNDDEILELSKISNTLKEKFNDLESIEFAVEQGRTYILQIKTFKY